MCIHIHKITLTFRGHPAGLEDLIIVHEREPSVREIEFSSQIFIDLLCVRV